jgi:hypothetical protein
MHKETSVLPTPVGRRKVEMSDKRQQIGLKLDPELAQALREMKQGHDESLSEVVIRLLRKLVRQNAGARGAPFPNGRGAANRGAFATGRRGKAMAPGRTGSRAASKGKPFTPREVPAAEARAATDGKRNPAGAWAPPRASRKRTGKVGRVFRPQPIDGSGEAWRGDAHSPKRAGAGGPRSNRMGDAFGSAEGRPKRPRKAKGRRSSRG